MTTDHLTDETCTFVRGIKMLSGKWDIIICHLLQDRPLRFNEIKSQIAIANGKELCASSLSKSLKRLEQYQIVLRIVKESETPIAVEYRLTEKGKALEATFKQLQEWSRYWV